MISKKLTFVNQNFSMNKQTKDFIQEHLNDDVIQLGLQAKRYPDVDMLLAIRQISGRQKCRNKVPIFYENTELLFPAKLSVEQASSEITAKYKAGLFSGKTFADLTGGFGVDFYLMSQHFTHGIYVERDETLCSIAVHNFKQLKIENFDIKHQTAEDFLDSMPEVDLIYIDPHRRNSSGKKTVLITDCEPDVSLLVSQLLKKSPQVLIKLSPMLDIHQAIAVLPQTTEVHVIAVENECKEVLFILDSIKLDIDISAEDIRNVLIKTANFQKNNCIQSFDFQLNEELISESEFTTSPLQFLYEPNAAIMKSGAFKSVATRFGLKKMHPNTHLYTDEALKNDFPGRIFEIEAVFGNSKADLRLLKQTYPKANIATRNYPLTVDAFRKKSGIKDGGDHYLFAMKTYLGNFSIVACKKIDLSK